MSVSYDPFSAHWTFPFKKPPSTGPTWRHAGTGFGYPRSGGRAHAGCDILKKKETPLYAISKGKVRLVESPFTNDFVTDALWVEHDTYIVRYGEIMPGSAIRGRDGRKLKLGVEVEQGEQIAVVGFVGVKQMLHFELYYNDVSGHLSNEFNRGPKAKYRFVPIRDYLRRSDLLDPTLFLDRMADNSGFVF